MPIRVLSVDRERSLAAIARRAYNIEGTGSTEALRRAEAALLKTNPQLGERANFKKGVSVVIPEVSGLTIADGVQSSGEQAASVVDTISSRLDLLANRALPALASEEKEAKATVTQLKSARMKQIISKNAPTLVERIPEIQKAATERAAAAKDSHAKLAAVFAKAKKDLDDLSKKLG